MQSQSVNIHSVFVLGRKLVLYCSTIVLCPENERGFKCWRGGNLKMG
jgi:hypothetical protein